jgi:hypothetical protein
VTALALDRSIGEAGLAGLDIAREIEVDKSGSFGTTDSFVSFAGCLAVGLLVSLLGLVAGLAL